MKKSGICGIVVGLTVLILSCGRPQPSLTLLSHQPLRIPSASAIVFNNNRLWVLGDDASYISVLSTGYEELKTITFWPGVTGRIPKDRKPDIESAYVTQEAGKTTLHALGSQSAPARWKRFEFDLDAEVLKTTVSLDSTTAWPEITECNIEGSCVVAQTLVTANRGNLGNPQNHLLIWKDSLTPIVKPLYLPQGKSFAGISDICYVPELDLLLFTASEEASINAYEDGAIGESYVGWINSFSRKMNALRFDADGWINLSKADAAFAGQKIEGVCAERIDGRNINLYLVSDNDGRTSWIFNGLLSF